METTHALEADPSRLRRQIMVGIAFWLIVCTVALPLRGVRWDEDVEHGQAITRQVNYPDAHPFMRYARAAYSLQTYLVALQLAILPDPVMASAARNWLRLVLIVVPFFLLAVFLTRSTCWAHILCLLLVSDTFLTFCGYQLLRVWPTAFSHGPIGGGWMLLALCLILARRWRAGYFMLGMLPCIHLGQCPLLYAMAAFYTWWAWRSGERDRLKGAAVAFLGGVAVCVAFRLVQLAFMLPAPTEGPYFSNADPVTVWRNHTAHDSHRLAPGHGIQYFSSHVVMVAALLLGAAAARREHLRTGRPGPFTWYLVFNVVGAAVTWITMTVHLAMGSHIPTYLLVWMPYRVPLQQVFPLLLLMVCAVVASAHANESEPESPHRISLGGVLLIVIAAIGVLKPWLADVVGETLYERYLAVADGPLFALMGCAGGVLFIDLKRDKRFLWPWCAITAAAALWLAFDHQFGAVCAVAGFVVGVLPVPKKVLSPHAFRSIAATAVVVGVAVVLMHQWQQHKPLLRDPFDAAIAEYLEAHGQPDAMLVTDNFAKFPQVRTGHPVMAHWQTATYPTYMLSIGPAISKIYGDIFGISFGISEDEGRPLQPRKWQETWAKRSRAEWQALGNDYGFEYVWAPNTLELALPVALAGERDNLYHIPGVG